MKLRALLTAGAIAAGGLFALGGASVATQAVTQTAAHASGLCPSGWSEDVNTYLWSLTGDGNGWPWMGYNGNASYSAFAGYGPYYDLLSQNQTPYGDPGYGLSGYEYFDACYNTTLSEVDFYNTGSGTWLFPDEFDPYNSTPGEWAIPVGSSGFGAVGYTCDGGGYTSLYYGNYFTDSPAYDSPDFETTGSTTLAGADKFKIWGFCGDS